MASAPERKAKSSGITTTADGSFVPSSTRADGSMRKEIRVRPGYQPPEDVEVYKNRTADAWRNRGKRGGGVPGAEFVGSKENEGRKSGGSKKTGGGSTKVAKPEKSSQNEKLAKSAIKSQTNGSANAEAPTQATTGSPEEEREKEARKLNKKLRQARDLKQKKDEGNVLLPEQLEKVIKINELIRQLDNLGFDAEGQKKATNETDEAAKG